MKPRWYEHKTARTIREGKKIIQNPERRVGSALESLKEFKGIEYSLLTGELQPHVRTDQKQIVFQRRDPIHNSVIMDQTRYGNFRYKCFYLLFLLRSLS